MSIMTKESEKINKRLDELQSKYVDQQITITKWVNLLHGMLLVFVSAASIFGYVLFQVIADNEKTNDLQNKQLHDLELQNKDVQYVVEMYKNNCVRK